jgi:hypothetical protein
MAHTVIVNPDRKMIQLITLVGALDLHTKGLRRRGIQATTIARSLGYKGSAKKLHNTILKELQAAGHYPDKKPLT